MTARSRSISVAASPPGTDEAMKAGIGAAACSVLILAIVFLVMQMLPVSTG